MNIANFAGAALLNSITRHRAPWFGVFAASALMLLSFDFSASAVKLDTLVVEGLSINQPAVIRNNVKLKSGSEFNSMDVQDAIKRLNHLGLFKTVDFYVTNETDSSVSLLLKVEENPVCESIEFHGAKKLKQKDFEEKLTIRAGQTVSDALIYDNVKIIRDGYAEKGYLLADVSCNLIETRVPGNVIAKFDIKEGVKVRVKKIIIEGDSVFSENKLKRKLKTKENKWYTSGEFSREQFSVHLDSLLMFYHDKGYLDARIINDSVWYAENKKDIFISFKISEGLRYLAGDFHFSGNKVIESPALAYNIALKKGKPFDKSKFELTKGMIANAYREEGYLWVQLKDQMRRRGDTIDVVFDIAEGRPAVVRKIEIEGNEKTYEKVIRRELVIYPGQKYKQSRMERSVREAMALNYFDNVAPDLRPNEDGTIDLVFDIKEKENIGQFSAGVMYSQVEKFGGNFSVSIPNFRGAGQELSLASEFSTSYQRFSLGFVEPWIFDTPTRMSSSAFYRRQVYDKDDVDEEEFVSYGVEFGLGRRLKWPDDYFKAYLNYGISKEQSTFGQRRVGNMVLDSSGYLSKITGKIERNDTDLPNFPNSGSIFTLTGEYAGLGHWIENLNWSRDDFYRYVKGSVSYDWYFPLFWKFVLGLNSEFGLLGNISDSLRILATDVFTAGGVYYGSQIRGYDEETFGGRYNPDRSKVVMTFSSQVRFPILDQQLYFAVFGDMGNTWGKMSDVDLTEMYTGVGFGLRLMFPMIGLMGFDFAWGLDSPGESHIDNNMEGYKFHFLMNRGF